MRLCLLILSILMICADLPAAAGSGGSGGRDYFIDVHGNYQAGSTSSLPVFNVTGGGTTYTDNSTAPGTFPGYGLGFGLFEDNFGVRLNCDMTSPGKKTGTVTANGSEVYSTASAVKASSLGLDVMGRVPSSGYDFYFGVGGAYVTGSLDIENTVQPAFPSATNLPIKGTGSTTGYRGFIGATMAVYENVHFDLETGYKYIKFTKFKATQDYHTCNGCGAQNATLNSGDTIGQFNPSANDFSGSPVTANLSGAYVQLGLSAHF